MAINDRLAYKAILAPIAGGKKEKPGRGKPKGAPSFKLTVYQRRQLLDLITVSAKDLGLLPVPRPETITRPSKPPGGAKLSPKMKIIQEYLQLQAIPSASPIDMMDKLARIDDAALLQYMHDAHKTLSAYSLRNSIKENRKEINKLTEDFGVSISKFLVRPAFGILHLDRLRFTPLSVKEGEFLYSLPLTPGEEVTLTQKDWSKVKREFTEIVNSELEKTITTQRTESQELSESTMNQLQFGAELGAQFQGSGTIGVVSLSGQASTTLRTSSTKTTNEAIKNTQQLTESAASRSKQEHKTTFQVSSEIGAETESKRIIRNPNRTHAVRYDFFRYMREWRVDLERYGARLTMDVMVKDPGKQLRSEYERRAELEEKAYGAFQPNCTADQIDESNLPPGVSPRPASESKSQTGSYNPGISTLVSGITEKSTTQSKQFDIPQGYAVTTVTVTKTSGNGEAHLAGNYVGQTGPTITVQINCKVPVTWGVSLLVGPYPDPGDVGYSVTLTADPTRESMDAWESGVVQAMNEQARQQANSERAQAQALLDVLLRRTREIPTLELRKDERYEIMAGVFKQLLPPGISSQSAGQDTVRFLHEAFEWENMTYYLYPYFWADIEKALEIDHPDMLRRNFLKSGWARVLIPIRHQYEEKVLNYSYSYDVAGTAPSEMRTVAQQIFDDTQERLDYQPVSESQAKDSFDLLDTWYQFTPTDGLQIIANFLAPDVAEPVLAQELKDAQAQRALTNRALEATALTRELIAKHIEELPEDSHITLARDSEGDQIELKESE
jgi:hypothetical protein